MLDLVGFVAVMVHKTHLVKVVKNMKDNRLQSNQAKLVDVCERIQTDIKLKNQI